MFEPDVLRQEDALIACRRRLHERPELSFHEFETTEYLENALREMGVDELSRPCKTGLIATIHGTKPGSAATLGVRADIDALPIQEDNDLPYRSKTPGVMHACGHDAHAAIALTLARLLCARRSELCGTVRLLFQHAEELPPGGAIEMVRAGAAEGLDAVLGIHLSTTFPSGHFGVRAGALTANTDRFDITILGKGGHCALPETCIDPVVTGAQIILALQTLVSRRMAAVDPAVVSVCQASAGNAYNIIPNTMTLTGTTRCLGPQARAFLHAEMERIVRGITQAAGAGCEFSWQDGYPSVMNDEGLTKLAEQLIEARFGAERVLHISPLMPGEDYPYFLEDGKRPGFFVELGTRNAACGSDQPHHNPHFKIDEDCLKYGVQFLLDMALRLLDGTRDAL